jgi:hypothetical protein
MSLQAERRMEGEQATFVLIIRAEPGVNAIRTLRAWLKIGLRTYGLRCVEVQESNQQGRMAMDARKYAAKYVKPDQVRDGPIQTRIINVFEDDRYGRLMLELENGSQFGLNEGNTNTLITAWGYDTNDWVEQEIEFSLGFYKDWNSNSDPPAEKETVKVRAIAGEDGGR